MYSHSETGRDTFGETGVDTASAFFILEAGGKGQGAGTSIDGVNLEVEENLVEARPIPVERMSRLKGREMIDLRRVEVEGSVVRTDTREDERGVADPDESTIGAMSEGEGTCVEGID